MVLGKLNKQIVYLIQGKFLYGLTLTESSSTGVAETNGFISGSSFPDYILRFRVGR